MKSVRILLVTVIVSLFGTGLASAEVNPALRGIQKGKSIPAPASLNADQYVAWLDTVKKTLGVKDFMSAFTYNVFEWFENEKGRGLPQEVFQSDDRIFVNVDRPKAETSELEDVGEIESSTTIGAEVYAEMDGTVAEVMEAMLYRWGKPIGKAEGETHPAPAPFSQRVEYFAKNAEWGENAFANVSSRKNGGFLSDLDDRYLLLIYGDANRGYDLVMQYFAPNGKTATKKSIVLSIMRPLPNGKTAFKITTRYQGQSYGLIPFGRSLFGFNESKVRAVQQDFSRILAEYKRTGKINEAYPMVEPVEQPAEGSENPVNNPENKEKEPVEGVNPQN